MPDLIIFDCDGTLVNSEHIYNAITAQLLNEIGYPEYTPELCMDLFAGHSWSTIRKTLETRHDNPLPNDIIERYIKIANTQMNHDIEPIEHANTVLTRVKKTHKICVGSNGERGNVIKSLEVTNLLPHFDESQIFTKIQVKNPKPAPDLFLFACEQMNIPPAKSLVIEDSPTGVKAAIAANIKVLGFTGTAHNQTKQAKKLKDAGATIIINALDQIHDHI